MCCTDGEYLPNVMLSVNKLKPPPLMNTEWAKDGMADTAAATEQGLRIFEKRIQAGEVVFDKLRQLRSGKRLGVLVRDNRGWCLSSAGKMAEAGQCVLNKALKCAGAS